MSASTGEDRGLWCLTNGEEKKAQTVERYGGEPQGNDYLSAKGLIRKMLKSNGRDLWNAIQGIPTLMFGQVVT